MTNARPGWYPDPSGDATKLRYYDGTRWTDDYMASPQQASAAAYVTQQTTTTTYVPTVAATTPAVEAGALYAMTDTDRTLRLIAFVLNVIVTVCCGIFIIPLAWMIPMTIRSWGIYKGTKPNTVAFGVCTLIFLSTVSGILLLCSQKNA